MQQRTIFIPGDKILDFELPGTCKVICNYEAGKTG